MNLRCFSSYQCRYSINILWVSLFLGVGLIYNQTLKRALGFRKFKTIELPCSFLGPINWADSLHSIWSSWTLAKVSFSLSATGNISPCTTETKHEPQAYWAEQTLAPVPTYWCAENPRKCSFTLLPFISRERKWGSMPGCYSTLVFNQAFPEHFWNSPASKLRIKAGRIQDGNYFIQKAPRITQDHVAIFRQDRVTPQTPESQQKNSIWILVIIFNLKLTAFSRIPIHTNSSCDQQDEFL